MVRPGAMALTDYFEPSPPSPYRGGPRFFPDGSLPDAGVSLEARNYTATIL
jgi:hypothetical protein